MTWRALLRGVETERLIFLFNEVAPLLLLVETFFPLPECSGVFTVLLALLLQLFARACMDTSVG